MSKLYKNTTDLQSILDAVNALPEAGSGSSGGEEWIGDGNTHIWISLQEGRTSPMLGVCPNGTVTVDWGDGSAPDTLTGTSTSTVQWTPNHEYGKAGDYVITLIVDGEVGFSGNTSTSGGAFILRHSSGYDSRNYAYRNSVQKVELADGVTSIGQYAFNYCYSLASVSIPDSVTSIGDLAFFDCYCLTSVSIPGSVTSIGSNAFNYCYSLASVSIPDSVTSIGTKAFEFCYGLTSISIPNSVTRIGTKAFNACYSLDSVIIPDGVTSIDESTFSGCYCLTSVSIPGSVTSIGSNAFYLCYCLTSVSIPGSVTSISQHAFNSCSSIACYDFTSHTTVPALANTNAFTSIAADCKILVPASLADEWKAATNWSTYAKYIVGV